MPRRALPRLLPVVLAATMACPDGAEDFELVRGLPHDPTAYTQGLLVERGVLYESTGRYGESDVRRVDLETGAVLARTSLPPNRFGEGLALLGDRLYQLTWKAQVGYVYDAATLARVDSFAYQGEGWGLTTDGAMLIKSNGSAVLEWRHPRDFQLMRSITVRDGTAELTGLNELEYVDGQVYANVYPSDWIVRIDAATGRVLQWYDMEPLSPRSGRPATMDVLNGIAYDAASGRFFVTGKLWPRVFEVVFAVPDSPRGS